MVVDEGGHIFVVEEVCGVDGDVCVEFWVVVGSEVVDGDGDDVVDVNENVWHDLRPVLFKWWEDYIVTNLICTHFFSIKL